MGLRIRLDGLLAKVESTYGTDALPTAAADGVKLHERLWSTLSVEYAWPNERIDEATGSLLINLADALPRGRMVTLEIAHRIRGAGVAYSSVTPVRPEADPLLVACGLSRTHTDTAGSERVDYAQADDTFSSCTIYAYAGGNLYRVVGCRGTVSWAPVAGELGSLRFRMQGILTSDPAASALPSITYDATVPPAAVGMALTVGPWSPSFTTFGFEQQADTQRLDSANAADGIDEFDLAGVDPRFRLTARAVALATYDPYADVKNQTARAINATLGSAQYNRLKLVNSNSHLKPPITHRDVNGFAMWDLTYRLRDFILRWD